MGMNLMARYRLSAGDAPNAMRGADLLRRRGPDDRVEVLLVRQDGTHEAVGVPEAAVKIIVDILERASGSGEVALLGEDTEISPEDAATILGISRPLVRRRMDLGELPFRRVGSHRRVRMSDVLALKAREAPIRSALAELQADTDDLSAHGL
jgi:excisionase family DNA binding protein